MVMVTELTTKFSINRPSDVVFDALVNPERIGNYWFSSSSERWEQGKKIILKYDEYGAEGIIHILEIIENKRIVYSWGTEPNETTVTIALKHSDRLNTIIEVTESGFQEDDPALVEKLLGQKQGWVYMLSCLKGYLEHGVNDLRASLVF